MAHEKFGQNFMRYHCGEKIKAIFTAYGLLLDLVSNFLAGVA